MNSMFDNFTNINTTFTPNPFECKYPQSNQLDRCIQTTSPNKPFEIKDASGKLTGYFWYYGNSVDLVFDIT